MKTLLFIELLLAILIAGSCRDDSDRLPSFSFLMKDSSTIFRTEKIPEGRPIVFMYFSPDCDHCQAETENILKNMSALKEVRFYFITIDPFARLRFYDDYYQISKYDNIVLGKDNDWEFLKIYQPKGTPYLAIFDRGKRLRYIYDGGTAVDTLIKDIRHLN